MEWQTEKLSGWVDFRKLDGESICNLREFEIPASEAVGVDQEKIFSVSRKFRKRMPSTSGVSSPE